MKIECPKCGYSTEVDSGRIPAAGENAKCPCCSARFFVAPPEPEHTPKDSDRLTCPKCGAEQEQADICGLCGLVFEKCRIAEERQFAPNASSVNEQGNERPPDNSNRVTPMRCGIIVAVLGFIIVALLHISAIKRSTSSAAAIGLIFVPMTSFIWSLPFFVFGCSVGYVWKWAISPIRKLNIFVVFAFIAAIGLFSTAAKFAIEGLYLSDLISEIQTMNVQELPNTMNRPLLGKNKFVLGAIAQNKNASGELLRTIGVIDNPELYEKMGSLFDVLGENRHGLAVMRLVARNPNVLPETLEHLATCTNDYVLGDVAGNEKTSQATLIKLSQRKNYLIDWGLARNPATPAEILSSLSYSLEKYTREPVARNPGTPLKDLERLAADSELIVRIGVASNPNVSADILKTLSTDANDSVRQMVANNKKVSAETLQILSKEGNSAVSSSAQMALRKHPEPFKGSSIQTILETMQDPKTNSFIRAYAAEALGKAGVKSPEVITALIAATNDSDEGVRRSAVYSLGSLDDKTVLPVVEKLMKDKVQSVKYAAQLAFAKLTRIKGLDVETIALLDKGAFSTIGTLIAGNYYAAMGGLLATLRYSKETAQQNAAVKGMEAISGKRFGADVKAWEKWIADHEDWLHAEGRRSREKRQASTIGTTAP